MTMFTLPQLKEIMPGAGTRADLFYYDLINGMEEFSIYTPPRMGAFLATIAVESGQLHYVKEIWGPTAAQERYEGRIDLGNTEPGDGKRFMGRGLIQLTGRANYSSVSHAFGVDFVKSPELLETMKWASISASWFFATLGCNQLADKLDFENVTRRVNGGFNGYATRLLFYKKAMQVLSVPDFSNVMSGVTSANTN